MCAVTETDHASFSQLIYPLVVAAVYLVAATFAARADSRGLLYTTQPPRWLAPGRGYTPWRQVLVTARIFHSLLRWRYVMPGHTGYTHLQLTHSLLTYILLTACCVLLFLGADQCTKAQNLAAAVTSSAASSFACLRPRFELRRVLRAPRHLLQRHSVDPGCDPIPVSQACWAASSSDGAST